MLIFPVGDRVPSPSRLTEGHPTQPGECVGHAGIPDAQDLHTGPRILWTSGALQEVYQGVCQYCMPLVRHAGERSEDGSGGSAPQSLGGRGCLERKGPVHACPSVSRLRKAFPVGNGCLQGGTGSGALPETERWMVSSHCLWESLPDPSGEELS